VPQDADSKRELPPVTFASFIVSLAQSAMSHLGEGPGATLDPAMAKHSIDLLGILRDKTKGNLDEEENRLLETLLYETRMRFMEKTKGQP